ncbi:MAG: hypothetical protein ABIE22_01730 [archaeon]
MKKRGFEFSFSLIFAILAGLFIIFLALYTTMQFIHTSRYSLDTETAKSLSIIFNPLETGIEAGKSAYVSFSSETKIYNECSEIGNFGYQEFSLASKSGIGPAWQEPGGEITLRNKYIFSDVTEGKRVYMFSTPFEAGFKVASLTFMYTEKYCFKNPPEFVEDTIRNLNLANINLNSSCNEGEITVCFGSGRERDCDMIVSDNCRAAPSCREDYDVGYVDKGGERLSYYGNLVYAAIFSSPELYECNVKRLAGRTTQLAYLYVDESMFLQGKDCHTGLESDLMQLAAMSQEIKNANHVDLLSLYGRGNQIKLNAVGECCLWECVN